MAGGHAIDESGADVQAFLRKVVVDRLRHLGWLQWQHLPVIID